MRPQPIRIEKLQLGRLEAVLASGLTQTRQLPVGRRVLSAPAVRDRSITTGQSGEQKPHTDAGREAYFQKTSPEC